MSYSLDANVLLHAANADSVVHQQARAFLDRCVPSDEPLCLTWGVATAFLRISTHPGIFREPLTPIQAMDALDQLFDLPQTRLLVEDLGFWKTYRAVATAVSARAKAVPDAHLAALLRFHGVRRLYTSDRDFRKFEFLEVIDPFQ